MSMYRHTLYFDGGYQARYASLVLALWCCFLQFVKLEYAGKMAVLCYQTEHMVSSDARSTVEWIAQPALSLFNQQTVVCEREVQG